jgi:signal peptidase I
MEDGKRRADYPLWVKVGLWGLPNRSSVWAFAWLSAACGAACCAYGIRDGRFLLLGVAGFAAALTYGLTVRWVDRHGSWSSEKKGWSRWLWVAVTAVLLVGMAVALVAGFLVIGYYQIPQNGMYPSLPAGSRLLGIRHPYGDVSEVGRGDVIVFFSDFEGKRYLFIWRVVGLPGDVVRTTLRGVELNGAPLPLERGRSDGDRAIFRERNGEAVYEVAYGEGIPASPPPDVAVTVPPGHLFVLGDNRHNALDSRYLGPIPFESIVAKKW